MASFSTSTPQRVSNKGSATTTTTTTTTRTTLDALHPDLQSHILTRLDGQTLTYASCVSSQFHAFCTEESLWTDICLSTWPSTNDPRVRQLISTFPNGPRSFFSDSFPLLVPSSESNLLPPTSPCSSSPELLISAVDIQYRDELIFSKVQETETQSRWFRCSPFRLDFLDIKDVVPTPIRATAADTCQDISDGLTLSWITIDPTGLRAANLSSWKPVSVQRHWLSGEIQARFATILAGDRKSTEFVQCGVVVTCGACEGGEMMQVREIYLQVEDMEGMNLNGMDSLGILRKAMRGEGGKRMKRRGEEGKQRYEEYLRLQTERKERKLRREGRLDAICIAFGFSIVAAFWALLLFR
ncbi:probable F-box protein At2g36090 [Macadamia integrifolia]|uniref:probable F-box protein At2g36090 n=1 Tax=Macadamia integrifolia TaxID=60698 RepID=UPI001C4F20A3|nr:probable F-box protein At2g36090 [Macadamia integrifolia]